MKQEPKRMSKANESLVKELNNEENRNLILNKVIADLENIGDLSNCALEMCVNRAKSLNFDQLIHSSAEIIIWDIADYFYDQIEECVCEKYPKLQEVIDAEPTLQDDEYYDEFNTLMDIISIYSIDEALDKLRFIDEVYAKIESMAILKPFTNVNTEHRVKVDLCGSMEFVVKGEPDEATIKQIVENMLLDNKSEIVLHPTNFEIVK